MDKDAVIIQPAKSALAKLYSKASRRSAPGRYYSSQSRTGRPGSVANLSSTMRVHP